MRIMLGVNVDHVATLRNARGTFYPDPTEVALMAMSAGADFITVHLREDRRHINESDLYKMIDIYKLKVNLEIATTDEMVGIALTYHPHSVCFVPEKRAEITTEGGLQLLENLHILKRYTDILKSSGIQVSLFVEPDQSLLESILFIAPNIVEIHTGRYCDSSHNTELHKIERMVKLLVAKDIECHAGHGMTYEHAQKLSSIQGITAFNIGHFIVSESVYYGVDAVVKKMLKSVTGQIA